MQLTEYTGHDLIIATGVPGSQWSAALRIVSFNEGINRSDESKDTFYEGAKAWHSGAYWGPYHKQGHNFDRLDLLSKEQVITEFKKPYREWNLGIKIIKSHWFAYHLPLLKEMFPDAKFIATYRTNEESFDWWHVCGGWDIGYPHYTWYVDNARMQKQIAIENEHILDFFKLKRYNLGELLTSLGLKDTMPNNSEIDLIDTKLGRIAHDADKSYLQICEKIVRRNKQGII